MIEKALTTEQKLRMTGVFLAFALLFGIIELYSVWEDFHLLSFVAVEGQVIKTHQYRGYKKPSGPFDYWLFRRRRGRSRPEPLTEVKYGYQYKGKDFSNTETVFGNFAGKEITIYLNPNNPREATMALAIRNLLADEIVAGLVCIALLVGAVEWVRLFLQLRSQGSVA